MFSFKLCFRFCLFRLVAYLLSIELIKRSEGENSDFHRLPRGRTDLLKCLRLVMSRGERFLIHLGTTRRGAWQRQHQPTGTWQGDSEYIRWTWLSATVWLQKEPQTHTHTDTQLSPSHSEKRLRDNATRCYRVNGIITNISSRSWGSSVVIHSPDDREACNEFNCLPPHLADIHIFHA